MSSLKDIILLSSLHLSFGRNSLSNKEIGIIASGLGDCGSLESLNLNFIQVEKLAWSDVRHLVLGLNRLILLKSFHLELKNMEATNEVVVELVEGMTGLKSLECARLNVSFPRIVAIDINSVENLENLRHLRELRVNNKILF